MHFTKPATTYEQQAALIRKRGMIADSAVLVERLRSVGYYRLCAYWYPFKQPDETFATGTSFDVVWGRYRFDRQLRLAVMDAVERAEVAIRTMLLTELALAGGPFVHLDPARFPHASPATHQKFVDSLRDAALHSNEAFVAHFRATYDEFPDLPIWAAAEIMSFGTMLTLFKMSPSRVQKAIARRYGIGGPVLLSWLLTLNYVRNVCAHHARLWNRELALKPLIPYAHHDARWHEGSPVSNNRVFVVLTILNYLIQQIAPQSGWRRRLFDLFDRFPEIPLNHMGIPDEWRTHPLWRQSEQGAPERRT